MMSTRPLPVNPSGYFERCSLETIPSDIFLAPESRRNTVANIHGLLKPGGRLFLKTGIEALSVLTILKSALKDAGLKVTHQEVIGKHAPEPRIVLKATKIT